MDLSKLHVVIVDDDYFKVLEIRKALKFCGIKDIEDVSCQEKVWDRIYGIGDGVRKPDLIVSDMQYPLTAEFKIDPEAGFKLIERMKKEQIDIPVIICSQCNYESVRGILGSVWFRQNEDICFQFKKVLERL